MRLKNESQSTYCGERGIRTPGGVTLNGFQDRRNRPLCHLSLVVLRLTSAKLLLSFELCKFLLIFFNKKWQLFCVQFCMILNFSLISQYGKIWYR